jgi:lipid A disaccharide synthetase
MEEASSLKSREYLAYGLPMVLAYRDTDLDELDVDFLLKIPNTEDNIITHGRLIRDFAYKMRGKRVDRDIIAPLIDNQAKEKKRIEFFQEILRQEKSL